MCSACASAPGPAQFQFMPPSPQVYSPPPQPYVCYPTYPGGGQLIPPPPIVSKPEKKAERKPEKKAEPKPEKKAEPKPEQEASASKKKAPNPPLSLGAGEIYLYSTKNTKLHVIKGTKVWQTPGSTFSFKVIKAPTGLRIGDVIGSLAGKEGNACKGFALTEVVEVGGGEWSKGASVEYGSDRAARSLGERGWNEKRGESLPPVWVVLHRVEEKES